MPFVLEGIWAYKLTSLLEGDEDGRSGRAGRRPDGLAGKQTGMPTGKGVVEMLIGVRLVIKCVNVYKKFIICANHM